MTPEQNELVDEFFSPKPALRGLLDVERLFRTYRALKAMWVEHKILRGQIAVGGAYIQPDE